MGLSFHYSGSFNAEASLPEMIKEVKDLVEIFKWQYYVYEEEFPENSMGKAEYNQNIYGISFTPPGCETVFLCFLSNGKMSSAPNLQFYGNSKNKEEAEYLYMLSTKTQYAGIETHKLVIHLLKYLNGKYLQHFRVMDEGEYWETGDEKLLEDIFKRYTFLTEGFTSSLENYPKKDDESFETYIERLAQQLHEKYKKD